MALEGMSGGLTPPAESNVLQSFSDATAGRSLQLFYAVAMKTNAATTYALARDAGISSPTNTQVTFGTTEIDFDVTINKSTLVGGLGYADFTFAANVAGNVTVELSLIHYDGTTETVIGTAVKTPVLATGTEISYKMPLQITKKNFRVGDTLRLKAELYAGGAGVTGTLYHNPLIAGDELKLWLPVVNLE